MGRRRSSKGACPRCGRPISWLERVRRGDREYIVAAHYLGYAREGGRVKKRVVKCYLGPASCYEYVSRTHAREGLVFRGLVDEDRVISYLDAIIAYLGREALTPALAAKLAERFERLAGELRRYAEEGGGAEEGHG